MKTKGISIGTLKWLALIFMLLDHIGMIFFEAPSPLSETHSGKILFILLRSVGRMSFPLFLFCLTEGYHHTKDKVQYAKRLGLFALISEVPYDFGNHGTIFDIKNNNVIWTMLLIILMYICLDRVKGKGFLTFVYSALTVSGFCLAAHFGNVDYGISAICAASALYYIKERTTAYLLAIASLTVLLDPTEILAVPSLLFVQEYNGTKGRQSKYFFYIFYPAHLIILKLIYFMFVYKFPK